MPPPILAAVLEKLPQWPPSAALALALDCTLDRVLQRDALRPLAGRSVRLRVRDAGLTLTVRYLDGRFFPGDGLARVDLAIEADMAAFVALALRQEDPDTLFFDRRLRFTGDTELGLVVKNTLDAVALPELVKLVRGLLPRAGSDRVHSPAAPGASSERAPRMPRHGKSEATRPA